MPILKISLCVGCLFSILITLSTIFLFHVLSQYYQLNYMLSYQLSKVLANKLLQLYGIFSYLLFIIRTFNFFIYQINKFLFTNINHKFIFIWFPSNSYISKEILTNKTVKESSHLLPYLQIKILKYDLDSFLKLFILFQ